jgi:hypothetical protein
MEVAGIPMLTLREQGHGVLLNSPDTVIAVLRRCERPHACSVKEPLKVGVIAGESSAQARIIKLSLFRTVYPPKNFSFFAQW